VIALFSADGKSFSKNTTVPPKLGTTAGRNTLATKKMYRTKYFHIA
jgi:hypothetical protein